MNYAYDSVVSSNRSKRSIDKKTILELDNILVWEVSSDYFRNYFISVQGDDGKRIMVGSNKRESSVIGQYQRSGNSIRCFSVFYAMSKEEQDFYNSTLNNREYDDCISTLFSLELSLNNKYGYQSRGKVYHKKK